MRECVRACIRACVRALVEGGREDWLVTRLCAIRLWARHFGPIGESSNSRSDEPRENLSRRHTDTARDVEIGADLGAGKSSADSTGRVIEMGHEAPNQDVALVVLDELPHDAVEVENLLQQGFHAGLDALQLSRCLVAVFHVDLRGLECGREVGGWGG